MESKSNLIYLIILSVVNLIGILACTFIVVVNILSLTKGRRLNTCDLILFALAISGAFYQCSVVGETYTIFFMPEVAPTDYRAEVQFHVLLWSGSCSAWLIACLCVFYCVKIVDFKHPLIFWLKVRISKIMPRLLLGSVIVTFALSVPAYWHPHVKFHQFPAANLTSNLVVRVTEHKYSLFSSAYLGFGFGLPVVFAISSITLILISLRRHTQRMEANVAEFSQSRLAAHFGAARMLGSLLIVYVSYLLAEYCTIFSPTNWFQFIGDIIIDSFTPAQSIILILGNTKLRNRLQKILSSCRI